MGKRALSDCRVLGWDSTQLNALWLWVQLPLGSNQDYLPCLLRISSKARYRLLLTGRTLLGRFNSGVAKLQKGSPFQDCALPNGVSKDIPLGYYLNTQGFLF